MRFKLISAYYFSVLTHLHPFYSCAFTRYGPSLHSVMHLMWFSQSLEHLLSHQKAVFLKLLSKRHHVSRKLFDVAHLVEFRGCIPRNGRTISLWVHWRTAPRRCSQTINMHNLSLLVSPIVCSNVYERSKDLQKSMNASWFLLSDSQIIFFF